MWALFSTPEKRVERLFALNLSIEQKQEVAEIDQQIDELEKMKRGFESRALWHEQSAEWMQFEDRGQLETRRHLQLAEENRMKAKAVQEKIDELKKERQEILSFSK